MLQPHLDTISDIKKPHGKLRSLLHLKNNIGKYYSHSDHTPLSYFRRGVDIKVPQLDSFLKILNTETDFSILGIVSSCHFMCTRHTSCIYSQRRLAFPTMYY